MALNKFMHPRNCYKNTKPSFLHLALKYPEFRAHTTQNEAGKVFLDFKNADALRALTSCLLKEDFGLTVLLPGDRLVPTVPLRLNYIHWMEDIVGQEPEKWGIDIGTGASCIYPLLAAKMNQWHFLATEADPENVFHAKKNIQANGLEHLIQVEAVSSEDALLAPLEKFFKDPPTSDIQFDFCMCNPPFFADILEAQAITTSRSVERPEASSVSTASPQECMAQGGEVAFVRQMIEESAVLREKVRIYSSMVGKKASLPKLKEELRHHKVSKFSTTEFCQGKTMRWGIAWTFVPSVLFPKSQFEQRKEKPPLHLVLPQGAGGVEYTVHCLAARLKGILHELKIHCYQGKTAKSYSSITLTAPTNTWCHQRRLRRKKQREAAQNSGATQEGEISSPGDKTVTCQGDNNKEDGVSKVKSSGLKRNMDDSTDGEECVSVKRSKTETEKFDDSIEEKSGQNGSADIDTEDVNNLSVNSITDDSERKPEVGENRSEETKLEVEESLSEETKESSSADSSPKEYILKCVMRLKRADEQIHLDLEWLGGQSRELMHQLYTFLKNKLNKGS